MENYLDKLFNSKKCIEKTQKYREYKLTFGEFIYIFSKYDILYPKFQKDLNVDKINEMISSYKRNPNFFYFKNKIVLSYISHTNNIYIIDGQHRIELIKYLVDNNYNSFISYPKFTSICSILLYLFVKLSNFVFNEFISIIC